MLTAYTLNFLLQATCQLQNGEYISMIMKVILKKTEKSTEEQSRH